MIPYNSLLVIAAYMLGSVSSAILLCRLKYGKDIRELGSGNPGANNVQRNFGWKAGVSVFLFDFFKGAMSVSLVYLTPMLVGTDNFVQWQIIFGLCAVMGHIFPIFYGFRGGKGVSVASGAICALQPYVFLVCLGVFIVILLISKYLSLSVLVASVCYPLVMNLLMANWLIPDVVITIKIFSIVVPCILLLTHISNIKRLLNHTEEKFVLKKPV